MAKDMSVMESANTLLMIGASSCTYRVGTSVVKVPRIDDESEITWENAKAMRAEANAYTILGPHPLIANCVYISPTRDMIVLELYPKGNLKDYAKMHGASHLAKWARQMVESVAFVHSKGIRHSDLRLDQWLLDEEMNARLCDFNACGYDEHSDLGIQAARALGCEPASHFKPRDVDEDNTVQSDLFALGSALYELEHGSAPLAGKSEEFIAQRFVDGDFPLVSHMKLGCIILRCWKCQFNSATDVLMKWEQWCGL